MLHEDKCSVRHIGHQVQQDQAIASRVINLCNSALYGLRYTVAGGLLAEHWQLPKTLADVIHHHHEPEKARVDPDLTTLIYLGDLLMSRFQMGQKPDRMTKRFMPWVNTGALPLSRDFTGQYSVWHPEPT